MSVRSHQEFLNSPEAREKRIKSRVMGKGKITNPYLQELKERAEFRNKMRNELRKAAKQSFQEELDDLRRTNRLISNIDKDKQNQLEMEVEKLKSMIFDLKGGESLENPMEDHWNDLRNSHYQTIQDSFDLNNNSETSSVFPQFTRSQFPTSVHQQGSQFPSKNKDGLFVLSCAPVNNFEDVISNELAQSTSGKNMSIPQQVQQFNELQSLFALPNYEEEFTHVYSMRQQQLSAMTQQQKENFLEQEMKENRVRSEIDKHRGRLQYSREKRVDIYSPRAPTTPASRARSNQSSQMRSPRLQRTAQAHTASGNNRSLSPVSQTKSHSAPATSRSQRFHEQHVNQHDDNNNFDDGEGSVGDRLAGGAGAAVENALSANNSLKQIVRDSMNEYFEQQSRARSRSRSPHNNNSRGNSRGGSPVSTMRVTDLTIEEFNAITEKMKDDIKNLIEETVKQEIKADAKSRKFTKRTEAAALEKQKDPLSKKIETKVGEKIQQLQQDLEALRASRVHSGGQGHVPLSRPNVMLNVGNRGGALLLQAGGNEDEAFEDGVGSRIREEPNWFANNELSRSRDRAEEPIAGVNSSPSLNNANSGNRMRSDSGGGALNREMLRSIEQLLKKHLGPQNQPPPQHGHPHPPPVQFNELTNDLAQMSQLTDYNSFEEAAAAPPVPSQGGGGGSGRARSPGSTRRNSTVNKYSLGLGELFTPSAAGGGPAPNTVAVLAGGAPVGGGVSPTHRSRSGSVSRNFVINTGPIDPRMDPRYLEELTMQQNRIEAQMLQQQQQAQQAAFYAQQQELQRQAQQNRLDAHKLQNQQLAKQQQFLQQQQQNMYNAGPAPAQQQPFTPAPPAATAPAAAATAPMHRRGAPPPIDTSTAPALYAPPSTASKSAVAFASPVSKAAATGAAAAAGAAAPAGQYDLSPTPSKPSGSMKPPASSLKNSAAVAANAQVEAEVKALEVEYRGLMSTLLNLVELKTNIKKELKDWNTKFEKENGRPAVDADKAKINDRFLAYKMVSTQVQDTKANIKTIEEKTKKLKDSLMS